MTSDLTIAPVSTRSELPSARIFVEPQAQPTMRVDAVQQGRSGERSRDPAGKHSPFAGDLGSAAEQAARQIYSERDVQVSNFYDEATGRQVYRVADKHSGEVLNQSPPEELLRLYASIRKESEEPILALDT